MDKKENEIALKEIVKQQKELVKKIKRIQKLPTPKRPKTAINRAIRVLIYVMDYRSLAIKKAIIMAIPTQSVRKGQVKAIVAEKNNEVILTPSSKIIKVDNLYKSKNTKND